MRIEQAVFTKLFGFFNYKLDLSSLMNQNYHFMLNGKLIMWISF